MAACGTGCTIPEHVSFVQWHLILGGFSSCYYLGTWIPEVPARYLGILWTADYWCVAIVVQPSASGCSYTIQTAETRQTIYGHLALQALSCGTVYTPWWLQFWLKALLYAFLMPSELSRCGHSMIPCEELLVMKSVPLKTVMIHHWLG
jgi:hypothetical protein